MSKDTEYKSSGKLNPIVIGALGVIAGAVGVVALAMKDKSIHSRVVEIAKDAKSRVNEKIANAKKAAADTSDTVKETFNENME